MQHFGNNSLQNQKKKKVSTPANYPLQVDDAFAESFYSRSWKGIGDLGHGPILYDAGSNQVALSQTSINFPRVSLNSPITGTDVMESKVLGRPSVTRQIIIA